MRTRRKLAEVANSLHTEGSAGEGMSIAAIAREMGLSSSYVSELLSDPTGRHARKAKREWYRSQSGTCPRCGGEISPRAETCSVCQPRLLAVTDSPIVDGCYDRRPPAKRCSGCGVVKDRGDYNTHKTPLKDGAKALHLKAKCKDCQTEDNKAAIFRRALKKGRVPRYIFLREFEGAEQRWGDRNPTFKQSLAAKAGVSDRQLSRTLSGNMVTKRNGKMYKTAVLTVDLGLLESALVLDDRMLHDLPEWEWVVEDGPHRTYIGSESERGTFREGLILPSSQRKRASAKRAAKQKT